MAQVTAYDWTFEEAQRMHDEHLAWIGSGGVLVPPCKKCGASKPLPMGALDELDAADAEGWPERIEGELAGRAFARRYLREVGAEWEPLEESLALRLLACSSIDVPAVIAAMEKGEPFRTPFAEYRLVTG